MKYKINDIVQVHTYDLRVIGKIVNVDNAADYLCIKVRSKDGQMYEVCEQDIAMKLGRVK
jgi:hypothetical protein